MTEEQKTAREYMGRCIDALKVNRVDWDDPSEKDISMLREIVGDRSFSELAEYSREYDEDDLKRFAAGEAPSDGGRWDAADIADAIRTMPIPNDNILDIERRHVVSVVLTTGGPHFEVDFILDQDGEMQYAEGVYKDWGTRETVELSNDDAEMLWQQFGYIGDEIQAESDRNGIRAKF